MRDEGELPINRPISHSSVHSRSNGAIYNQNVVMDINGIIRTLSFLRVFYSQKETRKRDSPAFFLSFPIFFFFFVFLFFSFGIAQEEGRRELLQVFVRERWRSVLMIKCKYHEN